jgi:5-methylcytosine-specific restriction endonuclease McrA
MITKYVGVFCVSPKCGRFNVLTKYEVARAEQIGTDCRLWPEEYSCVYCGDRCFHRDDVIVHSLSLDGREPQYPHRG